MSEKISLDSSVPIYEPQREVEQNQNLELSAMDTAANIAGELSSAVGSLLTVHGEDYAETAFQRKMRAQQNKRKGRRM